MLKVSVIIPTYNRANLLIKAINSVLNQTFDDYEIIVIDDGSCDSTKQVVTEFGPRVKYFYQENKGRSAARNVGIKLAKGEYIAFLDADDLYLPDKLEIQVSALDANPEYGMAYSHAHVIDELGNLTEHRWEGNLSGRIYPEMLFITKSFITTPTVMVRSTVLKRVGNFDVNMDICEDLDLWRRIARSFPVLHILKPLSLIRQNKESLQSVEESIRARKAYYFKALADDPSLKYAFKRRLFSEMYFVYGNCASDMNDFKSARSLFAKSIVYYPFHKEVYRCFGKTFVGN